MATDTAPPWESSDTKRLKYKADHLNATLDDSMGSDFKVFKAHQQAERSGHLDKASVEFTDAAWIKHTEWHWQRRDLGGILDFWPSRWKAQFAGKMYYGERAVRELFQRLINDRSNA